jgi:hypothetical protein
MRITILPIGQASSDALNARVIAAAAHHTFLATRWRVKTFPAQMSFQPKTTRGPRSDQISEFDGGGF